MGAQIRPRALITPRKSGDLLVIKDELCAMGTSSAGVALLLLPLLLFSIQSKTTIESVALGQWWWVGELFETKCFIVSGG